ncbi:hypothetical protein [Paraburkholderia caledonica]|uniref:Uncharacterized protein n=1 Tax=Paraburkholderia caledonica TaxID=134536 RepID=A0AB73IUL3_9BURK|nr:hypothetical protein [Paraburkholderia caledonica]
MNQVFGLPQPITGAETVTIRQTQNGQSALCTMPLSSLLSIITLSALTSQLPTTRPSTSGVVWNNGGVVSIS